VFIYARISHDNWRDLAVDRISFLKVTHAFFGDHKDNVCHTQNSILCVIFPTFITPYFLNVNLMQILN
jgi:hypothetical protein